MPTLNKVLTHFGHIKRLIVVPDRGLLSLDNIDELGKIKLPSGKALELILAVPDRRYGEFVEVLQAFQAKAITAEEEIIAETSWHDLRLVVAHHPHSAKEQTLLRQERIISLQTQAQAWAGKLDGQDGGISTRGRKLSDSAPKSRYYHEVKESHLPKIVKVDLKTDLSSYTKDAAALKQAEVMDGKLMLVQRGGHCAPDSQLWLFPLARYGQRAQAACPCKGSGNGLPGKPVSPSQLQLEAYNLSGGETLAYLDMVGASLTHWVGSPGSPAFL